MQVFKGNGWTNARPAVLLLLSASIPIVLICGVIGYYLTQSQKTALNEVIGERAQRLGSALSHELETHVQLLSILSESPRLDPPVQAKEFTELGNRLRVRVPEWEMFRVTDLEGRVVLAVPESKLVRPLQAVVDIESHKRLVETKRAVIGNVTLGPRRLPAFPIRVPVIRQDKVVYGLAAVIRPHALTEILRANGLPQSWIGWIRDGKGRVVATTAGTEFITLPADQLVQMHPSSEDSLPLGRLHSGEEVRVATMPVEGSDWTVSVGMPLAEYQRISAQGLYVLMATGGVTLLLSALAVFLFLRELDARRRNEVALASWQRMDALGKLTGGVAHDFNNLLMVFQSGAESLKRRRDDEVRAGRILDGMFDAVTRGRTLTQRLLSFSRKSNESTGTTRLQDSIGTLRETLDQAAQSAVEVRIEFGNDLWPVRADPQALETALINLVTNAREAMPEGGLVEIKARNVSDLRAENQRLEGPGVAVTVSDEGRGMRADDVARIFEPFYTTKQDGSSGLGLSQVHAFTERSGGAVAVTSAEGRGSVFTLYLQRSASRITSAPAPVFGHTNLPRKMLVVDDTPSSLAVAKMALEDAGVDVIAVPSGRAALAALRGEADIDAVLTDIRMPGMSGLELADYIKALNPEIAIVLMTGFSEALEQGQRIELPVLMKPFTSANMQEVLSASWASARKHNQAQT
ncbi:ATP-binding protein [Rhizobium sp. LjRoot254]|uniref:ATP-binding protein n=1 Tax=Rhizobium sp. LjRoot254 TaxID=3342297 RepID=UPI003ECF3DC1